MSQQYSLRWNNHQPNFISMFTTLLNTQTLVDVTLAAEGKQLQAHKVVLSACSTYFQALFVENPSRHPIVILKDVTFADLRTMVDFMYYGEVNVTEEQLPQVLDTAKHLKIKGLTEMPDSASLTRSQGANADFQSPVDSIDSQRRSASPATSPSNKRKRFGRRKSSTGSASLNMVMGEDNRQDEPQNLELMRSDTITLSSLPHQRRREYHDDRTMDNSQQTNEPQNLNMEPVAMESGSSGLPQEAARYINVKSCMKQERAKNLKRQKNVTFDDLIICKQVSEPLSLVQQRPKLAKYETYPPFNTPTVLTIHNLAQDGTEFNTLANVSAAEMPSNPSLMGHESHAQLYTSAVETPSNYILKIQESYPKDQPSATEMPLNDTLTEYECYSQGNISAVEIPYESYPQGNTATAEAISNPTLIIHESYPQCNAPEAEKPSDLTVIKHESYPQGRVSVEETPHKPTILKQEYYPQCSTSSVEAQAPPRLQLMNIESYPSMAETSSKLTIVKQERYQCITSAPETASKVMLSAIEFYPQCKAEVVTQTKSKLMKSESYPKYNEGAKPPKMKLLRQGTYPQSKKTQNMQAKIAEMKEESKLAMIQIDYDVMRNPKRARHTPAYRSGPPLSCNYCWNTEDHYNGGIRRRKTKYHCPECGKNLCIVPCFHRFHTVDPPVANPMPR